MNRINLPSRSTPCKRFLPNMSFPKCCGKLGLLKVVFKRLSEIFMMICFCVLFHLVIVLFHWNCFIYNSCKCLCCSIQWKGNLHNQCRLIWNFRQIIIKMWNMNVSSLFWQNRGFDACDIFLALEYIF